MLTRLEDVLKKHHAAASWSLLLVSVVCYHGALSGGFVSDDIAQILQNPFVKSPHPWRHIFLGQVWSFAGGVAPAGFYRPLQIFTYWLIHRAAGYNPAAYHATQLALYAGTVWAVYQVGRVLLPSEAAAFVGALLWAVHPLHVEAVAWAAAIPEIGCALFCLLGFWMFLRAEAHSPANFRWHVAAAALYFPALFFKEVAFSFPVLLAAYWFCHSSPDSQLRRMINWLPYLAAAGVCILIRIGVIGNFSQVASRRDFHAHVAWVALGLLGQHARLFFWPVNLSEFRALDFAASLRSPWPWAAVLAVVFACLGRKREPHLSFLVLWWFVTLLPCLDYRQLSIPLVADRFSYLPSVGPCLALGYLAVRWLPKEFPKVRIAIISVPALAVVAGIWAVQTIRMIPHWHDDAALSAYSLRVSPNAAEVHGIHGVVLQYQKGDWEGAAREFRTALLLNAESPRPMPMVTYDSYIGLGQVALAEGREAEALNDLQTATRVLPNFTFAYHVLGSVYFPRGDYKRAAEYFQRAVEANPLDVEARFYLGTCRIKLGEPAQAAAQFHAAREVDPEYWQAFYAEAAALEAAGDKAGAARVRSEMPSPRSAK